MIDFIIGLICLLAAFLIVMLRKAYFSQPLHEIKRQAIAGDDYAQTIYPVLAYGQTFRSLLWLLLGLLTAVALVLFARLAPVWLGIGLVIVWLWLAFSWLPNSRFIKLSRQLSIYATPIFSWLLNYIYPWAKELNRLANYYQQQHTGIYEPADLNHLFHRQSLQVDNRLSPTQLGRLKKMLSFESALVKQYLRPWNELVKIAANDIIGPKLLDDLHNSGQTAFMVTKGNKSDSGKELVGVLNKPDIGLNTQGKVGDYVRSPIRYIQEDETIESALAKFSLTGQILFVVINPKRDIVGYLTLKEALSSILSPDTLDSESNDHDDSKTLGLIEVEPGGYK